MWFCQKASEWLTVLLSLTKRHAVPYHYRQELPTKVLKNCKTFSFSSTPAPRPNVQHQDHHHHLLDDTRPRPRLSFLSSRRLVTKTMVSRTTSLIKCTKFGLLILRKIIKLLPAVLGELTALPQTL